MNTKCSIKLVSMPWTTLTEPSLGLAILKSALEKEGFKSQVHHLNLYLLRYVSFATYDTIAQSFALNDFLFTGQLEKRVSERQMSLLRRICAEIMEKHSKAASKYKTTEDFVKTVLYIRRNIIPEYLHWCVGQILKDSPKLVGFTCMFDQTMASVALSKLIKQTRPELVTLFGGYAVEGAPGDQILNCFPWVDAIARGDGENTIVEIAKRLIAVGSTNIGGISGVLTQRDRALKSPVIVARTPMEEVPAPNYDDFFSDINDLKCNDSIEITLRTLPIESSRGCWWGQKNHCTFCGIDEDAMKYREKSAEKMQIEIEQLYAQYSPPSIRFNDYILPRSYFNTLLPELSKAKEAFVLGCELKANTTPDEMEKLRNAGFRDLQPGIESFSTSVLKKMKKGVSGIQNIRFLLNAYELGMSVNYNYLFRFPSDIEEDYIFISKTIPKLFHLQPPIDHGGVVLTRYAPLKENPDEYGVPRPISADERYQVMFSQNFADSHQFDYKNYAYYFEAPFLQREELENIYSIIDLQIKIWKEEHRKRDVSLSIEYKKESVQIFDSRKQSTPVFQEYGCISKDIFKLLGREGKSIDVVKKALMPKFNSSSIEDELSELIEHNFVFQEKNMIIALTIPKEVYEKLPSREFAKQWASIKT